MKTTKIAIALVLLSFIGTALDASGKKSKKQTVTVAEIKSNNGPSSGNIKSICSPCTSFTCPTAVTAPSGCTGPGCSGCTPAPLCCLQVNNLTIQGAANIATATVVGNAVVNLNANFQDGLCVEESASIFNNVCIAGNKNVDENANIGGFAVVLGTLQVANGLNVSGTVSINGNPTINGSVTVTGNENVTGTLTVGGTGQFNGLLIAASGLQVANGSTINSGGLTILNSTCTGCSGCSGCFFCTGCGCTGCSGCTTLTGCTGFTGAFINGNVCNVGNIIVADVTVEDDLTVDELATFNNVIIATGSIFITNGKVIMNDGLTVTGDEVVAGGSKIVGANLSVSGSTLFENPVMSNGGALFEHGLAVSGGQTVDNLTITSGSLSVSGTLNVNGPITSSGGVSSFSDLTITDTLNSSCPSGPAALVDLGGAGIGKDLWIGGAEFFAETASGVTGGVPTAFDYYEESCYSTAFTWGGTTTTPTASVKVNVLRVGNIVNLLIPQILYNNPGLHIDVLTSTTPIPARFRPFVTVRGPSSTIIGNVPFTTSGASGIIVVGGLGEYNIDPNGTITFGLPASESGPLGTAAQALGPQLIYSQNYVEADINTITYNINGCGNRCKLPCS